ncbi:GFA family protein [Vibrio europaeus]|uniref:GFA family protein n=1 Tax=Vibrio europaeus TaxID=300876 RepID=A0A178J9C7_9VIBR|nr:GFA family protein [Vibrio europaeus]MDC5705043.1 GFA family protein [Vibrio europaeus]MDC5710322.1 GFA family protein [Vibrio europaeus]MDC5715412.1 GFA family protein [Vibrio europaeus]MDC5719573.1 GFA family protein [Vibrio europaeus]MDC5724539.1 GFA family protein [Vibrio europaeus]
MSYLVEGSCQCGQVSYKLTQPPKMVAACHCIECQKLSTAPFSVTAIVDAQDIEFTGELKEWQRLAQSGNKNYAKFCPECGNRVYHFNPDDQSTLKLKLKASTPTNHDVFEPTVHVWVSEKQDWYQLPDGIKAFDKQP